MFLSLAAGKRFSQGREDRTGTPGTDTVSDRDTARYQRGGLSERQIRRAAKDFVAAEEEE